MAASTKARAKRSAKKPKAVSGRGLIRETTYLHRDEDAALVAYAERKGITIAEALRRIVRAHFKIED